MGFVKSIVITVLICVTAVIVVIMASQALIGFKRFSAGGITVTGSASQNFASDLIVWRGSFSRTGQSLSDTYGKLKADADAVSSYLQGESVSAGEIVFSSVNIQNNYRDEVTTDAQGNQTRTTVQDGYTLSQTVTIQSAQVDKIEAVSRDVTKLIDTGIVFLSSPPEYYYTKLDELKINMIADATKNARTRVEQIAQNSDSRIGQLLDSSLGVFQITAQNSSGDDYSAGGAFDTASKLKTAQVTVKLHYAVAN